MCLALIWDYVLQVQKDHLYHKMITLLADDITIKYIEVFNCILFHKALYLLSSLNIFGFLISSDTLSYVLLNYDIVVNLVDY